MATTAAKATAITGKKCTVSFGGHDGSAQITSASIDEQGSSNVIQTLAGSVAISQGVESSLKCDFLFDGEQAGGGFYAVLKAALTAGTEADVAIDGGGAKWDGKAVITSLSAEMPADDAVTCSAELTISGVLDFTPVAAPVTQPST
jgi:Phage tail tube protein